MIRKPKKNKAPKPPKPAVAGGVPPPPPKPPIGMIPPHQSIEALIHSLTHDTAGGKIPPPPPPPPSSTSVSSHLGVMQSIEKGTKLKKAETVDKSGPKVDGLVKIKKVDRKDLLKEIESEEGAEKKLKHAETVDKSAPAIECVKVKKIDRKGILESIEKGDAQLKHIEVSSWLYLSSLLFYLQPHQTHSTFRW